MHFPDFAISKITPKDGLQGLCKEVKSYLCQCSLEIAYNAIILFIKKSHIFINFNFIVIKSYKLGLILFFANNFIIKIVFRKV